MYMNIQCKANIYGPFQYLQTNCSTLLLHTFCKVYTHNQPTLYRCVEMEVYMKHTGGPEKAQVNSGQLQGDWRSSSHEHVYVRVYNDTWAGERSGRSHWFSTFHTIEECSPCITISKVSLKAHTNITCTHVQCTSNMIKGN